MWLNVIILAALQFVASTEVSEAEIKPFRIAVQKGSADQAVMTCGALIDLQQTF